MGNGTAKNIRLIGGAATWSVSLLLLVMGTVWGDRFMVLWAIWLAFPSTIVTGWALLVAERPRAAAIVKAVLSRVEARDDLHSVR